MTRGERVDHMQKSVEVSPSKSVSPARSTMDRPKPVYSDFSHMSSADGVGTVRFVVGLREENPDDIVGRVFPLTKIIPAEVKEKPKKPKPKKVAPPPEDKTCVRVDCAARKDRLGVMKDENKPLRVKVKVIEGKVETLRNKLAFTEKSIIMAEERNDNLNGQIEEGSAKIQSMTADMEKAESFNITLRNQLHMIQAAIENMKHEYERESQELQELLDDKKERKVIFSSDPRHKVSKDAVDVARLKFAKDPDSDSD